MNTSCREEEGERGDKSHVYISGFCKLLTAHFHSTTLSSRIPRNTTCSSEHMPRISNCKENQNIIQYSPDHVTDSPDHVTDSPDHVTDSPDHVTEGSHHLPPHFSFGGSSRCRAGGRGEEGCTEE